MKYTHRFHRSLLTLSIALASCSSPSPTSDADAAVAVDAAAADASAAPGDADPGAGVAFTVPGGGGSVKVHGASQDYTFEFPASAAGRAVTITPVSPATFGLAVHPVNSTADRYRDFFRLAPGGTVFADPVRVRPASVAGIAPFALLFADGSTAGTWSRLVDGAYAVPHVSGLGVPGSAADFCAYEALTVGGGDFCWQFTFEKAPPTYAAKVDSVGHATNVIGCDVSETCGLIQQYCCVDLAGSRAIAAGGWCPSAGGDNENFTVVYNQACKPPEGSDAGVTALCLPIGSSYGAGCLVTFDAPSCGKAEGTATCDGVTCTCGAKSFPQGAVCVDGSALREAVLAECP